MSNKKEEEMEATPVVKEVITDRSAFLSLKQLHNYTDPLVARGHAEYNKQSVLVRSKHPMDECLRRDIIEEQHHESAKRIRNYRDCAVSKLSGRTYNATGEGDPEMDAGTVYANVMRMTNGNPTGRRQWQLISIICFSEPNIDGHYGFSEADYDALFKLAPNIRYAFESVDAVFSEARKELRRKIDEEKKRLAEIANTP
jgi:hypothetical protein